MSTAIVPIPPPLPRCEITIRPAVPGDYAFVDRLQDMHSKALGFLRKAALEGKIRLGEVLIAEDETRSPVGYCISSNRYLKRDELGIVYQMNVVPGAQRKLVAATLLKAVFERAPYGCKLFCCWCAQDLDANYFWESLGFIPLAFRTGALRRGSGQARTHIFWQRRIREGDVTTPYWFPSKTDGGMMREDRLVLPIPPGVHWKSEMPILIPVFDPEAQTRREVQNALPAAGVPEPGKTERSAGPAVRNSLKPIAVKSRRVQFGSPDREPVPPPAGGVVKKDKSAKPKREKVKADPQHVAKARELRDRYLEHVNNGQLQLTATGKYDVSRALAGPDSSANLSDAARPLLPAA